MEDAAVEFLLGNLKQLQLHQPHLIFDALNNQIQVLESNLCLFRRLLNDLTDQNRDEDKTLEPVIKQIREVVYEAEDAVEAMVSQAAEKGVEKYFKRAFDAPAKLLNVVEQVELIGTKVKEIYDHEQIDLETKREPNTRTEQKNVHENKLPVVEYDMVGLEDQAATLIHYLTDKTQELDVISIVGMPGLGKTTLARRMFHHERVVYEFPTRLWVYISQNFRKRDVYLAMLRGLNCITEDMHDKTDGEIAQTLRARLEREKFLIVVDDLWNTKDWDDIRDVLPESNMMSKILITSRDQELSAYASSSGRLHNLRFLTMEEGWLLLRLTVFGKVHERPSDLEGLGRSIASLCDGLPLTIMLIGGILAKTASETMWEKIYNRLSAHANSYDSYKNVVSLSYKMLPCCLRPCFLYMGLFPEDFEIPVQRLIFLWIAEGFVQQKTRITSLEEIAMDYLKELIDRKLVIIGKVSVTGRIKTCRLHDSIRDFCLYEGRKYFFREIPKSWTLGIHKYRHVSISSEVVSFLSSQPYGPRVRTFLHFLREETILLPENVSSISDIASNC